MKPKIRSGHEVVHLERGDSIIGSMTYGLGQTMVDPEGHLVELNELLDGTRTLEEVVTIFSSRSGLEASRVDKFFHTLIENGHLEDASESSGLTPAEEDRYSRSAHYFNWIAKRGDLNRWAPQQRIRDSTAVILGTGGIGGAIATHLVASGIGKLVVADFDVVETSNLNRQYLFNSSSIGRNKVEVTTEELSKLNSHSTVIGHEKKIDDTTQIVELMSGCDLFFRAADKPDEMPYWVSDAALATRTPWIDCSYAGPMINCCTFIPGQTGCYRCMRDVERAKMGDEGRLGAFTDTSPDFNAALGPVVHMAGALAAYEGIRFLTDRDPQSIGRALHQNLFRYDHSYVITVPDSCEHEG